MLLLLPPSLTRDDARAGGSTFSFYHTAFSFAHMLFILWADALPALWRSCEFVVARASEHSRGWIVPYSADSQVVPSLLFFTLYTLYKYALQTARSPYRTATCCH